MAGKLALASPATWTAGQAAGILSQHHAYGPTAGWRLSGLYVLPLVLNPHLVDTGPHPLRTGRCIGWRCCARWSINAHEIQPHHTCDGDQADWRPEWECEVLVMLVNYNFIWWVARIDPAAPLPSASHCPMQPVILEGGRISYTHRHTDMATGLRLLLFPDSLLSSVRGPAPLNAN